MAAFRRPEQGSIWIVENIDARKHAERTMLELTENLSQRVAEETWKALEKERLLVHQARHAAMGEMIGNIAHQWRQPLSVLGVIFQNIRHDYREDMLDARQLDDHIDMALRTVQQMSATIDDFRNFFRPGQGEERFDLMQAIAQCLVLMDANLQSSHIAPTVSGPPSLMLSGHKNQLSHAIVNLVANAREALVERAVAAPTIDIAVTAADDVARIAVRDNAGGIRDEHAEMIFDPYFTTKAKGTGIGLYMVKTIIEQHMQGKVLCHNTGSGAEFILELPLKARPDNQNAQ